MNIQHKIIHSKDFIKTKITGEFDFDDSKNTFIKLASDPTFPNDYEILIDLRDAECQLSTVYIYGLAQILGKLTLSFLKKIAIVVSGKQQFDKAKFMELCAKNKGLKVQAFSDIDEAKNWLTTEIDQTIV
jgi:hypothetical protein